MQSRGIFLVAMAVAVLASAGVTRAALSSSSDQPLAVSREPNHIQANEYEIAEARVPGALSARQSVTAWQVTTGTWNGQSLNGLSLVLVQSVSEDGRMTGTTDCYISHFATAAQRKALLSAYIAERVTKGVDEIQPVDPSTWRIEPAVIKIEIVGDTVVIHLGAIA